MRGSEKLTALIAVAIPVLIALLGWPMFVNWVAGPPLPSRTPVATVGAPATVQPNAPAVAVAGVAATARPTASATAPVAPAGATAEPAPAATAVGVTAPTPVSAESARQPAAAPTTSANLASDSADPREAVARFYTLVSNHQFDSAVELWSPRMRAAFPPATNLNQRFSQTRDMQLQRVDILSQDESQATVAIDLLESDGPAGQRHFVGNWYLVRGSRGWMLDQPQLQSAP
jgi:hypothetical protein